MRSVDIIIVNWNAGSLLRECVDSIAAVVDEVDLKRVVVVDNASSDGSLDALGPSTVPQLHVLRNETNVGFSAACNQGAAESAADYLLFLNPDTRIRAGALRVPAAFLDDAKNAGVGIVGIQLVDERDRVMRTCARLPTPGRAIAQMAALERVFSSLGHFESEWDHASTREVDQVMGAFFFTRRTLFEELGGFDERFFVYLEEVDFSRRARQAGFTTWFLADAAAYHRGAGTSEQVRDRRLFYMLRSRMRYFIKHFSPPAASAYVIAVLTLEFAARLLQSVLHSTGSGDVLRAYAMLWRDLPAIVALRRQERPVVASSEL